MNGNWSPWVGAHNGMSADKYIAAYRHLHDVLQRRRRDQHRVAVVPERHRASRRRVERTRSATTRATTTSIGPASTATTGAPPTAAAGRASSRVFADIYAKLATKDKPIMIGEMASAEAGGDKAAWIDG